MTGVEKIGKVRELRYSQGLSYREIGRRVGLSKTTVKKILRSDETKFTYHRSITHQPVTEHIKEKVREWLKANQTAKKKLRLTARRMQSLLIAQDQYAGSYESVAKCVRDMSAEMGLEEQEAYMPLYFGPAEAFQFDWGEADAYIDGRLVTLQLAVVQLCFSRYLYARAYLCQKQELMLDAHRRAFEHFGGVCARGIYDNLKTAVKRLLKGNHRNLQEKFVRFCSHYLYQPDFCSPAKGNEKGRVEGSVGFVRRNFFVPVPRAGTLDELNDRLLGFCISSAREMEHPDTAGKTRYDLYLEEKDKFIELHKYGFECCRETFSVVDPCSRLFFDNNRYSVPLKYVGRPVMMKGYANEVVASFEGVEIARHRRVFGRKEQVLDPLHYVGLLASKPGALKNGLPFKDWKLPEIFEVYRRLLNKRYDDGDRYFAKTLVLLKDWPIKAVVDAISGALGAGILGDSYILKLLHQEQAGPPSDSRGAIAIKEELERYSAQQMPPEYYDEILRGKPARGDKKEILQ
jgi:transposase